MVQVQTTKTTYSCNKLVITAGAWAPKVLKPLGVDIPLQVSTRLWVGYVHVNLVSIIFYDLISHFYLKWWICLLVFKKGTQLICQNTAPVPLNSTCMNTFTWYFQPWRITVMYWKEKTPGMFSVNRFPCLRYITVVEGKHKGKHNLYGLPADEYPGMFKVHIFLDLHTAQTYYLK